jgi:hypothetical protein
MPNAEVTVERLKKYSLEDATGIGWLVPFLSESKDATPIAEDLLTDIINLQTTSLRQSISQIR